MERYLDAPSGALMLCLVWTADSSFFSLFAQVAMHAKRLCMNQTPLPYLSSRLAVVTPISFLLLAFMLIALAQLPIAPVLVSPPRRLRSCLLLMCSCLLAGACAHAQCSCARVSPQVLALMPTSRRETKTSQQLPNARQSTPDQQQPALAASLTKGRWQSAIGSGRSA
eukprot:scaffold264434_cov15-Tisochrysis_lutea.AAC.1